MHYGDKDAVESAILEVVIYKHEVVGEIRGLSDDFEYSLESIQQCKYINPRLLASFIKRFDSGKEGAFLDINGWKTLTAETWQLVTFKVDDDDRLRVESIEDVSESKNEFHRLH